MKIVLKSVPLYVLLLLIFSTGAVFAGAWTSAAGKSYHRLETNYFYSDQNIDRDGDKQDVAFNGEFQDINLKYYLEYGFSDNATLVASLYYKYLSKEDDLREDETWGFGDIDLGLKYRWWEGYGGVFSTQGLVKLPVAYDADENVPLGDGLHDLELRVLYGQSLWRFFPGYCNVEAAYRWREGRAKDQFRYLLEVGSDFGDMLYSRIKLDGIVGLYDDADLFDASGNPAATTDYDVGKLYLTLGCKINLRWAIEAEYTPIVYGANTAAGATWTVAIVFQP